jgi:predicted metal-dependent TIM-barrel fold hydrolase
MPTTLKVKVTKDILQKSKDCGLANNGTSLITHCAIAIAVRDLFPNAVVTYHTIQPFGVDTLEEIINDPMTSKFILQFDTSWPEQRVLLPEFEFEMSIPDSVIEKINIEELKPLLENHPTLQLIEEEI